MLQCCDFHDGCFREAHIWTETNIDSSGMTYPGHLETHIRTLFQLSGDVPSPVELQFDEVIHFQTTPSPDNCDSIISHTELINTENIFHFRVYLIRLPITGEPNSSVSTEGRENSPPDIYIASRQISWRNASNWIGEELRYGTQNI